MTTEQPEIRWEENDTPFGPLLVATHDPEPCVFVDHQCSCGRLEVGVIGGVVELRSGLPLAAPARAWPLHRKILYTVDRVLTDWYRIRRARRRGVITIGRWKYPWRR